MANTQEQAFASAYRALGEDVAVKGIMIAVLPADGELYKAADVATQVVIGINDEVGSAGDSIVARAGKFLLDNSSTNPVTYASIGADCYVEDEKTVAVAAGPTNDVVAGKVIDVVAEGVWVAVGIQ